MEKLALITKSGETMMTIFVMTIQTGEDGAVFLKNHLHTDHNPEAAHMVHIGMEHHAL